MVVVANALAGLWALAAHRYVRLRSPLLWWFTGTAQVAIFVQVGVGVILTERQGYEAPEFHELYGFATLVAVGILVSYRQQIPTRVHLLYGLGGLFLMGLGLRAMVLS